MSKPDAKAVIVCAAVLAATFCWADDHTNYWDSGSGTQESPFLIWTASHLHQMHLRPQDYGKYFKLMADIDMDPALPGNMVYDKAVIAPKADSVTWPAEEFTGFLDGNGKQIRNLVIGVNTNTTHDTIKGLIGILSGTVVDLHLENCLVSGAEHIGSIVGRNQGHVYRCTASGSVHGGKYTGGIAGVNSSTICGTRFDGLVTGTEGYLGGIVGLNGGGDFGYGDNPGKVMMSAAFGSVHATNSTLYYFGGLVGCNEGYISNCMSSNDVRGYGQVGGLVGRNGQGGEHQRGIIQHSYSMSTVQATSSYVGALVGQNYNGKVVNSFYHEGGFHYSVGVGLTTGELASETTFTDAGWDFQGESSNGTAEVWTMAPEGYPHLALFASGFHELTGSGTASSPHQLANRYDLASIVYYPPRDRHYALSSDIDLGDSCYAAPVAQILDGTLAGNDFAISGIRIHDQREFAYTALFAVTTANSEIRDLKLRNAQIAGASYVAGLAALNAGVISNCSIEGHIEATSLYCGGLTARNWGEVRDCRSCVEVVGTYHSGGLVGQNDALISQSSATGGVVTGSSDVGGLVGLNSGPISDSLAEVTVQGTRYVGGCVGFNADAMRNCYSVSSVNTNIVTGGLAGMNSSRGSIVNCYSAGIASRGLCAQNSGTIQNSFWDTETSGADLSDGGVGRTTAQMYSPVTFSYWVGGFWTIEAGHDYPRLAWQGLPGGPIAEITRSYLGSGTEADPYVLATSADAIALTFHYEDWTNHFVLSSDIDLDGSELVPIDTFSGSLLGNGHKLGNFVINVPDESTALIRTLEPGSLINGLRLTNIHVDNQISYGSEGLVSVLCGENAGVIRDVHVSDCTARGSAYVALLAAKNRGLIDQCSVAGDVHQVNVSQHVYAGALTGRNYGTVSNCCALASIACAANRGRTQRIGGLCGYNTGIIVKSLALGTVDTGDNEGLAYVDALPGLPGPLKVLDAFQYVGGFCGQSSGSIHNSYARASVSAGSTRGDKVSTNVGTYYAEAHQYLAGFCGTNESLVANCYATGGATVGPRYQFPSHELIQELNGFTFGGDVSNCFWDTESSGLAASDGGDGRTTAQMQTEATFRATGWDFNDVWRMNGYPSLNHLAARLGFDAWAAIFPAGQNGLADSPSGDGIPNLMKYVLGLSPLSPHTTADLFDIYVDHDLGALILQYEVSKYAVGVEVTHQQTSTLMLPGWSDEGIHKVKVGESATHETWQARLPMSGGTGFLKTGARFSE